MQLATAIAQIIAFFAAKGTDKLIAKWVAYFVIAWETNASKAALEKYRLSINEVRAAWPEKARAWDEWRKAHSGQPNVDSTEPPSLPGANAS